MRSYIADDLRRTIAERAQSLCEYCLVQEDDTYFGCEVDHIISVKHGGATTIDNLALACFYCNRNKGSDIGSIVWQTNEFVRFFNPRIDDWADHFRLNGVTIESLDNIGAVTTRILGFNDPERILEREELATLGRYPPAAALVRVRRTK